MHDMRYEEHPQTKLTEYRKKRRFQRTPEPAELSRRHMSNRFSSSRNMTPVICITIFVWKTRGC